MAFSQAGILSIGSHIFMMPYKRLKILKGYVDTSLGPFLRLVGALGVKPTHLTVFSLPLGLLGVWYLYRRPALSALLILSYFTLDFIDGTLARVTGTETEFGARLDFLVDRLVAGGFLLVYYFNTGDIMLPGVGLTAILAVSMEEAGLIKR
jgi:phosphatidylglycerophosphate synthase